LIRWISKGRRRPWREAQSCRASRISSKKRNDVERKKGWDGAEERKFVYQKKLNRTKKWKKRKLLQGRERRFSE